MARYGLVIAMLGAVTLALYPIAIAPFFNQDKWKNIQSEARKGIHQEDVQPGNMKVWTDPFDRKK